MSGMEHLIPIINELQNVFTAVGSNSISLPQLVVVGSQSSGKSSVLEHIVGRDFLPRGTGIVTRRPLILQLTHVPPPDEEDEEGDEQRNGNGEGGRKGSATGSSSSSSSKSASAAANGEDEWGEFLHLPGKKFFDFNAIREEIVRETERVTGGSKSISHQPLNLAIYSPHVLTLTLVDLPGITKVPVADQPADIEQQINAMILSYISSPHSIIVAVSAANTDIANSDSLKLAREVDPSGVRTLGVLTKIDLMDRGTDAMQVLNNSGGVELQHGFVGVVCRSQEAITQKRTIREALQQEKQFFSTHPIYRSIASRLGTPFLAKKLNAILMLHIQSSLPEIRNKISMTMAETTAELDSYGAKGMENADRGGILLPLISKYCSHLNDALEGRSPDVSTTELYGGARISYIFTEIFGQVLEAINPLDLLSDHDIRISIRNASGPRPALFIPEVCFELLVKKQIERLLMPSLDCVELVFHELQRVALQCELLSPELIRFPQLRTRLLQVFQNLLKSCLEPTKAHIEALIQCELSFINTSHSDFIGGSAAVAVIMDRISKMQQQKSKHASSSASNHSNSDSNSSGDLSSKVAGVTGNVTLRNEGDSTNKSSTYNSSYNHSRSISSSPLSTSAAAPKDPPPTTTPQSTQQKGGFLSNIFWRSPSPAAHHSPIKHHHHHQPGAPSYEGKRVGYLQPPNITEEQNGTLENTSGTASNMHEHELYAPTTSTSVNPYPYPSIASTTSNSSYSLSATSATAGAPSWHLRSLEPTERELIETEVIKILMQSYFSIVRKTIQDQIPKSIICFLVTRIKKEIQAELVRELYQPQLLDELLAEADDIAEKREACKELLLILQRAMDILNSARDYNAMA